MEKNDPATPHCINEARFRHIIFLCIGEAGKIMSSPTIPVKEIS